MSDLNKRLHQISRELVDKAYESISHYFKTIDDYIVKNAENGKFESNIYITRRINDHDKQVDERDIVNLGMSLVFTLDKKNCQDHIAQIIKNHYESIGAKCVIPLDNRGTRQPVVIIRFYDIVDKTCYKIKGID